MIEREIALFLYDTVLRCRRRVDNDEVWVVQRGGGGGGARIGILHTRELLHDRDKGTIEGIPKMQNIKKLMAKMYF